VRQILEALQESGSIVNTEVTVGTVVGVVTSYDSNLLAENEGPFDIHTSSLGQVATGKNGPSSKE